MREVQNSKVKMQNSKFKYPNIPAYLTKKEL
jgi:hypothetical protein